MILSLLTLDLRSPSVRQSLLDCQDLHRSIMRAFDTGRCEAKVLFRLIRSDRNIQVYVQSDAVPQWERIEPNGFHCEKMKDISQLPESFHAGQVLHFSLFGCPSKKVAGEGKNSRRVILRGEEAQLDWLKRQGDKYGFVILEAHTAGKGEQLSGKKPSGSFQITGIPFEGVLQVKDPEAFRKGFENGIGAEKAYGFGMLMVNRA